MSRRVESFSGVICEEDGRRIYGKRGKRMFSVGMQGDTLRIDALPGSTLKIEWNDVRKIPTEMGGRSTELRADTVLLKTRERE